MSAEIVTVEEFTTIPEFLLQIGQIGGTVLLEGLSFEDFCKLTNEYDELRMERNSDGKILIKSLLAGFGGARTANLAGNIQNWAENSKDGISFSSSAGFQLPDGATKSPDCAWITEEKYQQLAQQTQEKGFLKVVPDFVAEIISESDRIKKAKQKMTDTWIANGVKLAWLINPYKEEAFIYRADGTIEKVTGFDKSLFGEEVLPDFELELTEFRLIGGR